MQEFHTRSDDLVEVLRRDLVAQGDQAGDVYSAVMRFLVDMAWTVAVEENGEEPKQIAAFKGLIQSAINDLQNVIDDADGHSFELYKERNH